MAKKSNILWGITFVLIALFIGFHQFGFLENIGLPSVIFTILLIPVLIMSIVHLNYGGIFFPLAVLFYLYRNLMGLSDLGLWPLLLIAFFLTVGFYFLFPKKKRKTPFGETYETIGESAGSEINISARFNGSVKYVNTSHWKTANIDCAFGGLKVYFDKADIQGDIAVINLDLNFSGLDLYLPASWKVVDNVNYMFGGAEEKGNSYDLHGKTVVLNGKASFSGLTVRHI